MLSKRREFWLNFATSMASGLLLTLLLLYIARALDVAAALAVLRSITLAVVLSLGLVAIS